MASLATNGLGAKSRQAAKREKYRETGYICDYNALLFSVFQGDLKVQNISCLFL